MVDFLEENPKNFKKEEFPLAAIFHNDSEALCNPIPQEASIGWFVRRLEPEMRAFFEKESYRIVELPNDTRCIGVDFPYRMCNAIFKLKKLN